MGELISRVAGECTELEEYAILHYLKRLGDQNLIKFKDDASEESDKEPEGEEVAQLVAQALQGEGSAGLTIDEVICRVCNALGLEPEGHSSAIEEENFAEFDDMDVDLVGDVMAGVEGVHARETFYEIQPEGTLTCAMHAAHNVVGSAADPALDFTSFVKAHLRVHGIIWGVQQSFFLALEVDCKIQGTEHQVTSSSHCSMQ